MRVRHTDVVISGADVSQNAAQAASEGERVLEDRSTRSPPGNRCRPTALNPADAMHPQFEQSGFPPNWHGAICRWKSAEMQVVVCAKMQSSGDSGGRVYRAISPSGILQFRVRLPRCISVATTRSRSSGVRRSSDCFTDLRRVEADPDLAGVGILRPEPHELFEVAVAPGSAAV